MNYSFVIPVYNSEETLEKLIFEISRNIKVYSQSYEIILIDDCSNDGSHEKIKELKKKNKKIKLFRNKFNLGQHKSIQIGLKKTKGKKIFIMDCDLQDDPKYFSNFINKYNKKKILWLGLQIKSLIEKVFFHIFFGRF